MFAIRERGYDISREMAEIGGMRPGYRNQQKKSVLFKAPGLFIGALAFGAAGGWTASDLLASWSASGGSGQSCKIKGNVSIATGERIFHVPGQRRYRRRSAPSMESGGSARNLKLGRRAGGNRDRDALAWVVTAIALLRH
ncbi:hypothetical protein ACVMH6_000886 [Rhizobium leguminosarum]